MLGVGNVGPEVVLESMGYGVLVALFVRIVMPGDFFVRYGRQAPLLAPPGRLALPAGVGLVVEGAVHANIIIVFGAEVLYSLSDQTWNRG